MKPSPLVTVTIPVYNAEEHLADALASVLAQTYRHLDVVVVDDGSTDRSVEIARSFDDARCRVIEQANAGAPAARNTGVAASHGEMLAFLDADDVWAPDKIDVQVRAMAAQPDVAMVFGQYTSFSSGDAAVGDEPLPGYSLGTILAHRDRFREVGPLSTVWRVGDFIDWYGRAADLGLQHVMVAETVLLRRVHAGSLTASDREAWVDYAKIARDMVRRRAAAQGTPS